MSLETRTGAFAFQVSGGDMVHPGQNSVSPSVSIKGEKTKDDEPVGMLNGKPLVVKREMESESIRRVPKNIS